MKEIRITSDGGKTWSRVGVRERPTITGVLESPCTRYKLKMALEAFLQMDPIDAANDADLLALLMRQRVENFL